MTTVRAILMWRNHLRHFVLGPIILSIRNAVDIFPVPTIVTPNGCDIQLNLSAVEIWDGLR